MAKLEEHCNDCETFLGDPCVDVNKWMDDQFKRFGPLHRFMKHHTRGIDEAGELFGERGAKAAMIHILKDCGHIPTGRMWANQEVDSMGWIPGGKFIGFWNREDFIRAVQRMLDGRQAKDALILPDRQRL